MKKPRHPASDHAVVRYLERVKGMDIDAVRREIGRVVEEGLEAGACGVISGGFVYRIEGGCVVTVTRRHTQPPGRRRKKTQP
ncbi:hypothetical protein [Roseovarius mucosus]|uniref:hypothetical protein n=1 Tax=Roseovarius mucosus TaxID=215743 RepID=UPI003F6E9859